MPLIGSRSIAKALLDDYVNNGHVPNEFSYVGGGSYRYVYLHKPTNVIYKIDASGMEDAEYENEWEVKNAQRLYRKSAGDGILTGYLRIPRTSGFRFKNGTVVAMERVEGRHSSSEESSEGRIDLFRIGRFRDMHMYNYIIDPDGYVVPVDMASPRTRSHALTPENYAHDKLPDTRVLMGMPMLQEFYNQIGW